MSLSWIIDGFSSWIDLVAGTVVASIARLRNIRAVQLIEADDGYFSLRSARVVSPSEPFRLDGDGSLPDDVAAAVRGRDIELVLRPGHFLFRPLELPKRAAEFLDGIVRAQIDRLTPWNATEAVFGWTRPVGADEDRIGLTVVATARSRIEPHLRALKTLGAKSILVLTTGADDRAAEPEPIRVHEQTITGVLGVARVRSALFALLAIVTGAAALSTGAAQIMGADLDAQLDSLNQGIAAKRLAMTAGHGAAETSALRQLERRKQDRAATVLVLEALSKALPDNTFVTEIDIRGDKLQVVGISRDAPALVRLMEQSSRFTQATFVAPTTRAESSGERFQIEAQIKLPFEARP